MTPAHEELFVFSREFRGEHRDRRAAGGLKELWPEFLDAIGRIRCNSGRNQVIGTRPAQVTCREQNLEGDAGIGIIGEG